MDKHDSLIEQIDTLLENSIIEPSVNFVSTDLRKAIFVDGTEPAIDICTDPSHYTFHNEQVIALKALYTQLSKADKDFFIERLTNKIKNENDEISLVAFNVLCHLGFFTKVFPLIQEGIDYRNHKYTELLKLFSEFLKYEWNNYPLSELRLIRDWINKCFNGQNQLGKDIHEYRSLYTDVWIVFRTIYRQINMVLTKTIKQQIFSGYNPEINEDQNKLKSEFTRYNFPSDLKDTLDKIDEKFVSAKDSFDYKNCMDLIRSFTERLYQSVCIEIDNTSGREVDVTSSELVSKFFISKKLLTANEATLLVALRHFLSNEASHKLKSKFEDARLTRNLTIEYSLFLMKRLEMRITT